MSNKVNVTIVELTGNKEQYAALPIDAPVGRIVAKLLQMMNLPSAGPDGQPMSYKFYKSSGKPIPNEQTLVDAGIRDNDVLLLKSKSLVSEIEVGSKILDQRLVDANNRLGINIFLKLAEVGEGQNLIISPASIAIALGIAYNGSGGETRLAMEKTLQFEGMGMEEVNAALAGLLINLHNPDPEVELIVANSLWGREGVSFNEDFLQCNRDYFKAKIAALDFSSAEAASIINKWVCENTRNRIEGIGEPQFSDNLMLLLISAIYFKGSWAVPFLKTMTQDRTFNLTGGSVKEHPTMFSYGDFCYLKNYALFQAVNLPYGENERVSMYVFLPSPNTGIEGFCSKLNVANWKKWTGSFCKMNGMLGLPRFMFEYETSMKNALSALGMGMAFDEVRADFSGISSPPPQLYIGDVKHKTFIEVNEEGTVAAAATAIDLIVGETIEMIVDRPFFFSIVDNMTGVILFMGMVLEPKT